MYLPDIAYVQGVVMYNVQDIVLFIHKNMSY